MAETKTKRFEKVYIQGGFSTAIEIWLDKETGVNYLYVTEGEGGGLTPPAGPGRETGGDVGGE